MLDTSAAYGWFTVGRDANQSGFTTLPLGTEGFRVASRTRFWQSKYVVWLDGNPAAAESLGRIVSANILGRSLKAPVSNLLPPENLVQGTDEYILVPEGVTRELGLDPDTLGFDRSVEIASAEYRVNGRTVRLVLLLYPTQQIARKFAEDWDARSPDDTSFRKRIGPLLALVRGTNDPAVAETLLGPVNYESQVTWNEPPPDLFLPDVLLTIFTFIGIALFFTIVAGVGFGGLRLFVKWQFPDRIFDRPEDMEVIQLKLVQGVTRKELSE
jgi:hypothetical protein